jgi:hypothetical protein|nr:PEP-CTERM sorting domain-containing protein [Candidatus Acidoferrales bacterium]
MNDKHYKAALILLTLPLSFGGGTTTGAAEGKPFGTEDTSNLLPLKGSAAGTRGFKTGDVAGRFGAGPDDFAGGLGSAPGTFVSSFGAAGIKADANCFNSDGNCFPGGSSAMGFPMYDSSNNSETSQYSHVAGSAGPLGPAGGFLGGGGGSGSGPTSTPIATPEPGSFALLAGGLLMLAGLALRRVRRSAA